MSSLHLHEQDPKILLVLLRNMCSVLYFREFEPIDLQTIVNAMQSARSLLNEPEFDTWLKLTVLGSRLNSDDITNLESTLSLSNQRLIREDGIQLADILMGLKPIEYFKFPYSAKTIVGEIGHAFPALFQQCNPDVFLDQIYPVQAMNTYRAAAEYAQVKGVSIRNILVVGAMSPVSVIDWHIICEELFPDAKLTFIDLNGGMRELVANMYGHRFEVGDITKLNRSIGSFDLILTSNLIDNLMVGSQKTKSLKDKWSNFLSAVSPMISNNGMLALVEERNTDLRVIDTILSINKFNNLRVTAVDVDKNRVRAMQHAQGFNPHTTTSGGLMGYFASKS